MSNMNTDTTIDIRAANGGGFGSQRTDAWFNGPDGHVWHAVNRGDSQIARCRRTKKRWAKQEIAK